MDQSNHYLQTQIDELNSQIEQNRSLLSDPNLSALAQEEIIRLEAQKQALQTVLASIDSSSSVEEDPRSGGGVSSTSPATIEIRGAAGGDEAKIFALDLENMYTRFANLLGFKIEIIDDGVIRIFGKPVTPWTLYPYETFKYEAGVHRVQRVPVTESAGRIHTSTATVAVLPQITPKAIEIKEADLIWEFTRSGGPGGQNVNKVSTAVRLTYKPTGDVISVRTERYQQRNKEIALDLLRQKLWQKEQEKVSAEIGDVRSAIGSGMRSEKIRTYNYPQNRVTDHRINQSWHNLESIMQGNLSKVVLSCTGLAR